MQVSAEIRWFWTGHAVAVEGRDWFWHARAFGGEPGGGKERVDEYLWDKSQTELGIKRRGGKAGVEVKGRVAQEVSRIQLGALAGPVDMWAKWSTESTNLELSKTLRITKVRWLRKWSTDGGTVHEIILDGDEQPTNGPAPSQGCNIEFTEIRLPDGEQWWTLGFEAFGGLNTLARSLELVADSLGRRDAPGFPAGRCESYPAWLARFFA